MAQHRYDAIVLGLGGMGSAALYHLAKRGVRVCGIEQFGIAHAKGSSHGSARMIRKAYFEHPDYVPLLHRAYELWEELERESGETLKVECGLMLAGAADSELIQGLDSCYAKHDLPHERISAEEAIRRFPQFRLPEDDVVYFDPIGGYLHVEACIEQHVAAAQRFGAEVSIHEDAQGWAASDTGVVVTTAKRELHADRLVLTAGAWTQDVLQELSVPLSILRKVQLWYDSPNIHEYRGPGFPAFYVDTPGGGFYGFPAFNEFGLKIAEHTGGTTTPDPDTLNRGLEVEDETKILEFLSGALPGFAPRRTHFEVCMYSMTNDKHFIVDIHPSFPNVAIGAGFSGHGFKFASVIGECLADLAKGAKCTNPIEFLGLNRF